jgi:hypothetical protein
MAESPEERGREAVAHLQLAALEFINAMRVVLDIAEEAVREPGGVATVVSDTLSSLVAAAGGARPTSPDESPRVEHIRIS